jgi:hypothetical protein
MDCGIFMWCTAALYVLGLAGKGQLSDLPRKAGKTTVSVKLHLDRDDALRWGGLARVHMLNTLSKGTFNRKDAFFEESFVQWQ